MNELYLDEISVGDNVIIKKILPNSTNKKRLLDLGFTKGTYLKKEFNNMGNSLSALSVRGTLIALRKEDMKNIIVEALV